MAWVDEVVKLQASWSPLETVRWYRLPKAGDIAGRISVRAPVGTRVGLMIAGEHAWSTTIEDPCANRVAIPQTINMLKLGDHAAIITVDSLAAEVFVTYRLLGETSQRIALATQERVTNWYSAKCPKEWLHQST